MDRKIRALDVFSHRKRNSLRYAASEKGAVFSFMERRKFMTISNILNARSLSELLDAADEFCKNALLRDNDDECMELKAQIEAATGSDYLIILSSYMAVAEDGDEVVEALYEFVSNCRMFAEADEEETVQISKEEFEAVLDECEGKCEVLSCIEAEGTLNIAELPMLSRSVELCVKEKNDVINILLPRVNIQEDKEKYIANLIGTTLYRVISKKFDADYIKHEINRYIPTSRIVERSAKEMFVDYFYDVLKYKDRKPGIYTHFDKHMERVMILEFYRRIIQEYFKTQ